MNAAASSIRSKVTSWTRVDIAPSIYFARHWHDTYGFGFLERGAQAWTSGRGIVRGYPGEVISTNPGEVHDGRPLGAPTRRWRIVYMDADVMAAITAQRRTHAEIGRPVIEDGALVHMLRRLFARLERWNNGSEGSRGPQALAFEESLAECCVHLMARHGCAPFTTEVPSHDLEQLRERLADAPSIPPTLAELAAMAGLSRYQVLRRFDKAYGLPPHAWLLRRRLERARVLIRDGCTLATAAAEAGFADQSHMTRAFVRHFGFTPGAWRRATAVQ
jgi:AraC-like DNA-binding protein